MSSGEGGPRGGRGLRCERLLSKPFDRLSQSRDFQRAYRFGRRYSGDSFLVYVLDRGGAGLRVGIVVGHRHGGAVERNRLRRRIREAVRRLAPFLKEGADVVIIPRAGAIEGKERFSDFVSSLAEVLSQAGLLMEA
ncbi:MAG: ribonuclease P protein component [Armatimonadota bacterium]|nr:ribonuclease P protein component [Armatimonadota bacterium]MDR5702021.1 ribonuclease P protein component [Armatimonadota bacterium]MDR7434681.1 ribonuclease P protein component [Armatimonadota bacterium]